MEERDSIQRHTPKGQHGTMTGAVQLPAPTAWPWSLRSALPSCLPAW